MITRLEVACILEGELTADCGAKGTRIDTAGDSVLEAMNWVHSGTNTGTGPMRFLAVAMEGGGKANAGQAP
ncbi:MAG TPA: cupin domain-containing protein [Alphaproteobacteria bacterium]|nr:cupin domain-containing protein [Alphaproteobacteria bacterium]